MRPPFPRRSTLFAATLVTAAAWVAPAGAEDCEVRPVTVIRVLGKRKTDSANLRLMNCAGQPNHEALTELSVLARPHDLDRPTQTRGRGKYVAKGMLRLDARLLTRLDRIAKQWPGHPIQIVSGYRPKARKGSRHRHGEALDIRVEGVSKEDLVAFLKTIPGTGVGYYPNSVLTHVDVREQSYAWVDRSGPGEAADYGPWPIADENAEETRIAAVAEAREAMATLTVPEPQVGAAAEPAPATTTTPLPPMTNEPPKPIEVAPVEERTFGFAPSSDMPAIETVVAERATKPVVGDVAVRTAGSPPATTPAPAAASSAAEASPSPAIETAVSPDRVRADTLRLLERLTAQYGGPDTKATDGAVTLTDDSAVDWDVP
ncbi:MAG: DUF882 domain-containing protein [Myxococcales bacterium]|nr:DUF882 domain-containing protein [Myxococcales bacterium]